MALAVYPLTTIPTPAIMIEFDAGTIRIRLHGSQERRRGDHPPGTAGHDIAGDESRQVRRAAGESRRPRAHGSGDRQLQTRKRTSLTSVLCPVEECPASRRELVARRMTDGQPEVFELADVVLEHVLLQP